MSLKKIENLVNSYETNANASLRTTITQNEHRKYNKFKDSKDNVRKLKLYYESLESQRKSKSCEELYYNNVQVQNNKFNTVNNKKPVLEANKQNGLSIEVKEKKRPIPSVRRNINNIGKTITSNQISQKPAIEQLRDNTQCLNKDKAASLKKFEENNESIIDQNKANDLKFFNETPNNDIYENWSSNLKFTFSNTNNGDAINTNLNLIKSSSNYEQSKDNSQQSDHCINNDNSKKLLNLKLIYDTVKQSKQVVNERKSVSFTENDPLVFLNEIEDSNDAKLTETYNYLVKYGNTEETLTREKSTNLCSNKVDKESCEIVEDVENDNFNINKDDSLIENAPYLSKQIDEVSYEVVEGVEHVYEELSFYENWPNDDDISLRKNEEPTDSTKVIYQRKTLYDKHHNPIIEKVKKVGEIDEDNYVTVDVIENASEVVENNEKTNLSINYIIEELINTESTYVNKIEIAILEYKNYWHYTQMPALIGKYCYIFGNLEYIWQESVSFQKKLKACKYSVDDIAQAFISSEHTLFNLYPPYFKNKILSDDLIYGDFKDVIDERYAQVKYKEPLQSLLMAPIQRLGQYILILEKLQKELNKQKLSFTYINESIDILKYYMNMGNHYVAIASINDLPFTLNILSGSFLLRENFVVKKPKKYSATVFLFQEIIIITVFNTKNNMYQYKDSLWLKEIGIATYSEHPLMFNINKFGKKRNVTFVFEANNSFIKQEWVQKIEELLWKQLKQCKENHNNEIKSTL